MPRFSLPELPYSQDALEPHISVKTLNFHHKKHHNAYVVKLNELLDAGGGSYQGSLEDIIMKSYGENKPVFNNAAQIWNHTFYWNSMTPTQGGSVPQGVAVLLERDFGSVDNFKDEFVKAGMGQFGSGWVWLVLDEATKKLEIMKTGNAELPMLHKGKRALVTSDVWEHAYYLDFQNRRLDYLKIFVEKLLNWKFVEKNLEGVI